MTTRMNAREGLRKPTCLARGLVLGASAVGALALALVGFSAGGASAFPSGASASNGSVNLTDPVGDASGAPDITAVAISGDPTSGQIVMTVTANGLSTIDRALEPQVEVYLNTDRNTATGSPMIGAEFNFYYWRDANDSGWDVERWNGTDWEEVAQSATMAFSRNVDTMTWNFGISDIAGAKSFEFLVAATTWSGNEMSALDRAPDGGFATFDISAGAPATPTPAAPVAPERDMTMFYAPVIGKPAIVPAQPTAGGRVTVSFRVMRSNDHKPLTSGKLVCNPSIAGKTIPHTESLKNGLARLSFVIPKTAKGKQLKVTVTIKAPSYQGEDGAYIDIASGQTGTVHTWYSGQSATKIVTFPIR